MPRAALLSIHARVEGIEPGIWEDPSLVQLWGPRFSAYVVAEHDRAVFTLGRLADDPAGGREAEQLADRLEAFIDGRRMSYGEAGRGLGKHPNALRYAAPTGRLVMRWDGARRPTIWTVPPPPVDPSESRLELARRYLHVFGPATGEGVRRMGPHRASARSGHVRRVGGIADAGPHARRRRMDPDRGREAFRTPVGGDAASAQLLPSGDVYFLLQGAARELLVPDLPGAESSGHRGSGRVPFWSRERKPGRGDVLERSSQSGLGIVSRRGP